MSNLKWLSLKELREEELTCLNNMRELRGKINNQETRLHWIRHYKGELIEKQLNVGDRFKLQNDDKSYEIRGIVDSVVIYKNLNQPFPEMLMEDKDELLNFIIEVIKKVNDQ